MQHMRRILRQAVGIMAVLVIAFLALACWRFFSHQPPRVEVQPHNSYQDTLIVVADMDFEPYSFFDASGAPSGHDVEFVTLVANRMGMNLDLRLMTWGEARAAVFSGEAHVLLGLEVQAGLMEQFALSLPVVDDPFVVFGRDPIGKIGDLYGEKLATLENGGGHLNLVKPYRLEKNTALYPTYQDAFLSVVKGDNTYVLARYSVGRRMLVRLKSDGLMASGPRLASGFMHMGMRKDQGELMPRIDAAILELKRDGTLDRLQDKWLGAYVEVIDLGDYVQAHLPTVLAFVAVLVLIGLGAYVKVNSILLAAVESQREHLSKALEYQRLLNEATSGVFERIHEVDLTNDRAESATLVEYMAQLGLPPDTPYSNFMEYFCAHRVHPATAGFLRREAKRENLLQNFQEGKLSQQVEILLLPGTSKDYCWMRLTTRMFVWKADNAVHMITCWQNIDAAKRREDSLVEETQRDSMTGLYNKRATSQRIEEHLARPLYAGHGHALFMVDIDKFKAVNDCFGHDFGDHVIMEFAGTLREHCRESDVLGRVGGDEFMLFFPCIKDVAWAHRQARRLVQALHRSYHYAGHTYVSTASVGIALCFEDGACFETLYKQADTALYSTKQRGRNGYTVFGEGAGG